MTIFHQTIQSFCCNLKNDHKNLKLSASLHTCIIIYKKKCYFRNTLKFEEYFAIYKYLKFFNFLVLFRLKSDKILILKIWTFYKQNDNFF